MSLGCLILAASGFVLLQNSRVFHDRYGDSDLERFAVRPGISATIQYGSDHLACQVAIAPYHPIITVGPYGSLPPAGSDALMSSATVTEILEEIAPEQMRGKKTHESEIAMGCKNENEILEYENVLIVRSKYNCPSIELGPNREMIATIAFKRDICPKPKNPQAAIKPNAP
jgi:hypothetical protein